LAVQNDGRIELTPSVRLEVDGKTIPEIARAIADTFEVSTEAVELAVAEHKSQVVFLEGEVEGSARAVPYHGPESLVSFLKRTGGLTQAADAERVLLRRANAAEANEVRLNPYDQVVVEPSRKSIVLECLPPWLTGVKRKAEPAGPDPETVANPVETNP
jgi:protein involved in polysaccharide export with SLBB domain